MPYHRDRAVIMHLTKVAPAYIKQWYLVQEKNFSFNRYPRPYRGYLTFGRCRCRLLRNCMSTMTSSRIENIVCPNCRKPAPWEANPFRPFCSERCRMIDLGAWVNEEYRVPGDKKQDDEEPENS